ncbi:hypothetical protein FNV43_RR06589 [Rhamnella rubrinervis]|uniref:Glycosyl hydrolase family 32 N-terminal domain-containing protein n=1 Tax=Rhamnella rubrinervis TaxID=2594499 RepID=A0A8K0HDU3_9ROSA|nr:hypothetical protein FNV43_RR06589 [Rhamnella rubrinervis]
MAMASIFWLFCFLSFLLGHGVVKLEASHHVCRHLQTLQSTSTKQPYRTAYHFQPPKNWMNGLVGVDTSVVGREFKHALKVSLDDTKHDYYTIGSYNIHKDVYTPDQGSELNASALRYDVTAKKRRILCGWINESSSVDDDIAKGWSGVQAIPRTLWLHKSGKQLCNGRYQKLTNYIDQSRSSLNQNNDKTTYGTFLDIDLVHEKLLLRSLPFTYRSFYGGEFRWRGKGLHHIKIYPTLTIEDGAHLYALNYGTQNVQITNLNAWSMKKAQIN